MLTQKQERFTLNLFQGINESESYRLAGYSNNSAATVAANASRLAKNVNVLARLQELKQKAEDASIANVVERKQRLTSILRATIPDYVSEDGIKVDKQSPNVGAVAEITTKTKVFRKGGEPVNITNIKLHSPTSAIDLLNKMDGVYDVAPKLNVFNYVAKVVINENGHNPTKHFKEIIDGNGHARKD